MRLNVWLHLVHGCNFTCHYCYIPHLHRHIPRAEIERHSIDRAVICPLLNNLIGYCTSQGIPALRIIFAGGEPTLNNSAIEAFCDEAMRLAHPINVSFGLISNGSFAWQELLPLLQRYGIRLSLSADGLQMSHDKTRFEVTRGGRIGSWSLLQDNVDHLLASNVRPYFLYTVTTENFRDIPRFASFVHAKGLGFRLSLVRERMIYPAPIQNEIAGVVNQLYISLSETLDPALPIFRYAAFAEWNVFRKKSVACGSCKHYFAVNPAGDVASCQMRLNRTYGRAVTEEFGQIATRIRDDPANRIFAYPTGRTGPCNQCEFSYVCAGGCPQHTLLAREVIDDTSPWCNVYGQVMPYYLRAIARQLQRAVLRRSEAERFRCE